MGGGSPATREKARRLRHTGPASDALCEPRGDLRGETPAAAEPRGKANHEKTLGAREGRENRAKNRRETQKQQQRRLQPRLGDDHSECKWLKPAN